MKKYIVPLIVMILACLLPIAFAQQFEPATKIQVAVNVDITFDEQTGNYTYRYRISNKPDSIQDFAHISIEYEGSPPNIIEPEGWSGSLSQRYVPYEGELHLLDDRTPQGRPYVNWFPWEGAYIAPGSSTEDLPIASRGLPNIVVYYAQGNAALPSSPYGQADVLPEEIADPYKNSVSGKTLGPVDPPDPFEPPAFLDLIINQKEEAVTLGWIKDPGISTSLDQKLANAKKQIEKGNPSARNILEAVLNELEAQKGKQITNEAYYLLKFNILYLVERL